MYCIHKLYRDLKWVRAENRFRQRVPNAFFTSFMHQVYVGICTRTACPVHRLFFGRSIAVKLTAPLINGLVYSKTCLEGLRIMRIPWFEGFSSGNRTFLPVNILLNMFDCMYVRSNRYLDTNLHRKTAHLKPQLRTTNVHIHKQEATRCAHSD